ncbi:RNA-directed DNA polymerase, eukaryota [Tanacetum coccineum]
MKSLNDMQSLEAMDITQKAKVTEPMQVKHAFYSHFAHRFNKSKPFRLLLETQFPNVLSTEQVAELERDISNEEIKRAVWDCGESKSPGLDGYTFEFFRCYWNFIDQDVVATVKCFFNSGSLPRGCNSSFIALILKIQDAKVVQDFRPITLIGSVYKIISKILANRLSQVIYDLISEVQYAFLANRQILDGPFILNELISWCKSKKNKAMVFKVDFEKAYDSVRWDYLNDILCKFGFGDRWRMWINGCLNSSMGSVLVNGSPSSEFQFFKGLKQGDPLSPLLFILVMESLHISFNHVLEARLFTGVSIDDSVSFLLASGLKINIHKSKLMGIRVGQSEVNRAAKVVCCSTLSTSFSYLGVTVGGRMLRIQTWDEVVRRLLSLLSRWKLKTLSVRGRLTLLKSVLGSIPLYHMSIFKVPKAVINNMEGIRHNFFNGTDGVNRKMGWVSWDKVLISKQKGGLGVSSYFSLNRALLFNWARCIQAIHGIQGAFDHPIIKSHHSPWLDIIKEINVLCSQGINLMGYCLRKVGNGENTRLWEDVWMGDSPLKCQFLRLYALDTWIEADQYDELCSRIASIRLVQMNDRWVWSLTASGDFTVKLVRDLLDDSLLRSDSLPTRWLKEIPIKINVFTWKVQKDKLPSRLKLSRLGIDCHTPRISVKYYVLDEIRVDECCKNRKEGIMLDLGVVLLWISCEWRLGTIVKFGDIGLRFWQQVLAVPI